MKKARFMAIALVAAILSIALLMPLSAGASSRTSNAITQNVSGTVSGTVTGTFSGVLTITKFVTQNGQLYGVGTLAGTVTNTATGQTQNVSGPVSVPITSAAGSTCQILYLHTGEIFLNLLGLVVDIQPITISITAQQGSGNLLGNLLCAIANLLNNGGPLTSITNLLNQVLAAL